MHPRFGLPLGLFLLIGLTGCGGPRLRPVEGQVVFKDGQPLKGGMVILEPLNPQEQKVSPRGDIGQDGRFQVSTSVPGDGVLEGSYRVYLAPPLTANPADLGRVKFFPDKYLSPETSGINLEVTSGKNVLPITLERP